MDDVEFQLQIQGDESCSEGCPIVEIEQIFMLSHYLLVPNFFRFSISYASLKIFYFGVEETLAFLLMLSVMHMAWLFSDVTRIQNCHLRQGRKAMLNLYAYEHIPAFPCFTRENLSS